MNQQAGTQVRIQFRKIAPSLDASDGLLRVVPGSITFLLLASYLVNASGGNALELKVCMLIGEHGVPLALVSDSRNA